MYLFAHFSRFCAEIGGFMSKNIAIFASGNGTNAENIIRYFQNSELVNVELVLANKETAFVLERARSLNVPFAYMGKAEWTEGTAVLSLLEGRKIDFIVLAGFLARVPDCILHAYPNKIINIHPSLLPKFGGKGMYGDRVHEAVVAAGEAETGITIHYLNERFDEGEIVVQYKCPVLPQDTAADVAKKVHALEYEYYPKVIDRLLTDLH
ncbi:MULTISPECIES: phosphoribosylglycinamide formyltransferase [Bacteroides]|uniref:phosphoribosylglycinamide formyltransferase n=1 Tax=Bacteroides TaxID=816 RepID=UPI000E4468B7|nr:MULTISPECIES: phosphoribosylglycinamide formyltransferase [Bacteroides]MBS7573422.1 phosphoribosylglycinamide formyltransferase [Bacteroides propionicigenes]RGM30999.1 phosphoribosylglycinamide formyltransferase [Bacteroides sp. OM08-17BH]RHJ54193.1 phosphoribosylglycinamide formyltransferase [Bacteroides sp. AM10-21B]HBO05764.1 phosphoribosylglycinamide formyltransferase [Bacteroides sp.]